MSYLSGNYAFLIDIGKVRTTNEDSANAVINSYGNVLLLVADGMGGANKGEYASNTLVKNLVKEFLDLDKEFVNAKQIKKWLNTVIVNINNKIYAKSLKDKEYEGMGTTLSLCLIVKDLLVTAQVGDSRIYQIKNGRLTQISVDQTYAQYLVSEKKISPSEANTHKDRHMLTNAIGVKRNVSVDLNSFDYNGEKILVCSDGLYNNVNFSVIESILKGNDTVDRKCLQLITFGNANGGSDNMAVVIWESNE